MSCVRFAAELKTVTNRRANEQIHELAALKRKIQVTDESHGSANES